MAKTRKIVQEQGVTPLRGPGRPPKLSRDQVLQAAYELLRTNGRDAITMRALARELRVGAMSIYTYFKDKEELLEAVAAFALDQLCVEEFRETEWTKALAAWTYSLRKQLLAHPEVMGLFAKQHHGSPQLLRIVTCAIRILENAGFDRPTATRAVDGMLWITIGFASLEIAATSNPKQEPPEEQFAGALATMSEEECHEISSVVPFIATGNFDALFASIVERQIAGLECELESEDHR